MHRKILPMALMYANGGEPIVGRTRMQKLVFLMEQHFKNEKDGLPEIPDSYSFMAYDYGPFSKELYSDLDYFIQEDMVTEEREPFGNGKTKYIYHIEDPGIEFVEHQLGKEAVKEILDYAKKLKQEHNNKPLPDLIKEVYSRYPKYAENSVY
ncbi:hypothetical protein [Haloferax denitrificans]|uniref:hypothetical protein n=1 Tax=Haloferax denitrificans TaxID=35745 RepID=UPI003C6FF3C0